MLARIKSLAVTVQHAAVHTVSLHSAQQNQDESTKAFAARVRGIASNCNLSKKSGCVCNIDVSYLEETVYHVVLAGLRDRDLQERCTAQALLQNITDLQSLVAYCTADESGRIGTSATVGSLRKSSYKKDGPGRSGDQAAGSRRRIGPTTNDNRCSYCGEAPHTNQKRENSCKAFKATCNRCQKTGHFAKMCQGTAKTAAAITSQPAGQVPPQPQQSAPAVGATGEAAPLYFYNISTEQPPAESRSNHPRARRHPRRRHPPTLTGREQQPPWEDPPHESPGHSLYAPPAYRRCGPGETVVPVVHSKDQSLPPIPIPQAADVVAPRDVPGTRPPPGHQLPSPVPDTRGSQAPVEDAGSVAPVLGAWHLPQPHKPFLTWRWWMAAGESNPRWTAPPSWSP